MHPKRYSLESYALFAATILGSDKLKAQLISQNFEPDLRLMNWSDYADDSNPIIIDIDGNGIFDLEFGYNYYSDGAEITILINDCVIGVGVEESTNWNIYFEFLNTGQLIGESHNWTDEGNKIFWGTCQESTYSGSSSWVSYGRSPFVSRYLPVKLQIDSEIHFGWVRLSINKIGISGIDNCWNGTGSPLTIFSVSYNDIANEPVICDENILPEPGSILLPRLNDALDIETISDFAFRFTAEEPDYSEIRFYLVPTREDMINFSANDALLLDPSKYFSIPAGAVIPGIENIFSLPETLLDINGNAFVPDKYYSGYYMKMPEDGDSPDLTLSTPLNISKPTLHQCSLDIINIEMQFLTNKGCFQVSFPADSDESDVGSYGIGVATETDLYFLKQDSGYVLVDTNTLIKIPKTGASEYLKELIGLETNIFGEALNPEYEYAPVVFGFGDGYYRDLICYSYSYEFIDLPFVAHEVVQVYYFDNMLSVDVLPEMIGNCKMDLVSVMGQKILSAEITQEKTKVDIGRLSKGIYLAVIYQNETQVEIFKFEKN